MKELKNKIIEILEDDSLAPYTIEELQNILNHSLKTYQLIMTGIGVLAGIIVFVSTFFYKENGYVKQEQQPPFFKSLKICFKNKNCI